MSTNNKTNSEKLVTIRLTDNTGHSTLEQKIDDAIATTVKEHFAQGKWPWIGARPFQFEATGLDDTVGLLQDTIRLREMLEDSDEPIIVLTGALVGGC